jgi:hypothetical protein
MLAVCVTDRLQVDAVLSLSIESHPHAIGTCPLEQQRIYASIREVWITSHQSLQNFDHHLGDFLVCFKESPAVLFLPTNAPIQTSMPMPLDGFYYKSAILGDKTGLFVNLAL